MTDTSSLTDFGWSQHFQGQLSIDEIAAGLTPVRVTAVHHGAIDVVHPTFTSRVLLHLREDAPEEDLPTAGDWLVLDRASGTIRRVLVRKSLLKRKMPGTARRVQLIGANVDTMLVVSSCNQDFNLARLERYLVLAREANVYPVVVLTKADLADSVDHHVDAATRLMPGLVVEAIDARDPNEAGRLTPWCGPGQTVALLGSSGVGKSTLVNSLSGASVQATAPIREGDARGRHTTTGRTLLRLAAGGWLLDTPGMRELQLAGVEDAVGMIFDDVTAIAAGCRFSNCRHETEPGCAVRAAIEEGRLEADRVRRFRKLAAESVRNAETLAQRHERSRAFGKMVKAIVSEKRRMQEQ
jgi:ribosome biogenesis GTPase